MSRYNESKHDYALHEDSAILRINEKRLNYFEIHKIMFFQGLKI